MFIFIPCSDLGSYKFMMTNMTNGIKDSEPI